MPLKKSDDINDRVKKQIEKTGLKEQDGKLIQFVIRLSKRDKEILEKHFRSQGLGLSTGIRQILKNYISEKNL